jgi:flagellin
LKWFIRGMDAAQNQCPSRGDSRKEFMVINTNISAQTTASLLEQSSSALSVSLARLSSGSKINSPADDSAGLAVSMNLVAEMGDNTAAASNVGDAISFNQTQDGYLQQVNNALDRMSELSVQAQDVTKSASDRTLYQNEFKTLAQYVNNVGTQNFNGVSLFDGANLSVPVDSTGSIYTNKGVDLTDPVYSNLANSSIDSLATTNGAAIALADVTKAISTLALNRANVGTNIETLTDYSNELGTLNNNLSAANSQIMDVDVAQESTNYARENILVQTGTAMLAQANALPQIALKLLS